MNTALKYFIIMFLLCITGIVTAQDVILKKDNSTVLSKVLEISSTEIKYKKWSNQDGPTYSISISEVASISYQNGDVEKFSGNTSETQITSNIPQQIPSQYKGYMDHKVEKLTINGRELSDEEVRTLFDPQTYQKYLEIKQKAKNQYNIGLAFSVVGAVSMSASCITYWIYQGDNDTTMIKASLALLLTSIATLTPGLILSLTAGSKLNPIAEKYNKKQGIAYTFNISPSVMRCETPQSHGSCGIGLTLSMNF